MAGLSHRGVAGVKDNLGDGRRYHRSADIIPREVSYSEGLSPHGGVGNLNAQVPKPSGLPPREGEGDIFGRSVAPRTRSF